jgi:hypothetical protein
MASLFSKLNYKGQNTVLVLNAPESFEQALDEIVGQAQIITAVEDTEVIDFVLSFVMTLQEIEESINAIAPKLGKDATIWFCYPKGTSKNTDVSSIVIMAGLLLQHITSKPFVWWPLMKIGVHYALEM